MSTERSSSAVRNLRSIFESKESDAGTPERQQRSASQEGAREGSRPLSKVRSSFVVVEQPPRMAKTPEGAEDMAELTRESSAALRRQSFSENGDDHDQLLALKKVVSQESERRERDSSVQETIPEAAIESTPIATPIGTPVVEPKEEQVLNGTKSTPSGLRAFTTANPDKVETAVDEEEPGTLKPANPADVKAVSGGEALGSGAEDISSVLKTKANGSEKPKPAALSFASSKTAAASSLRSPVTSKPAAKAPVKELDRKVSRSSLAAPTAASNARTAEKRESLASNASTKPKARESTRPLNISSHLLAPTAASKAKHEQDAGKTAKSVPVKTASTRPTPRASLARPESRTSQNVSRKTAPSDGSFLDRMTRPTAASQNRVQEKYEAKSTARKTLPLHKKPANRVNGAAKSTTAGAEAPPPPPPPATETLLLDEDDSILDLSGATPEKAHAAAGGRETTHENQVEEDVTA